VLDSCALLLTMSAQPLVRIGGTAMDAHNLGSNVSEDSSGSTGTTAPVLHAQ
jgi:hypothetical protein